MTTPTLEGEVAVVTGASGGLGRHFALTLAKAGAKVAAAARRQDKIDQVADEIRAIGRDALAVSLDVTDPVSVAGALGSVEDTLGPVTILVNNAGVAVDKAIADTGEQDWDMVLDTNLQGPWLMAREAAARMIASETPGRIVNIVSILGMTATARVHGYAASKAALIHLTRTLAVELARHGIRVNALAPGYVETDMNREFLTGPPGERLVKRVPLRRFARPDDLDAPLLLLAGAGSAYMTGSVLTVDGGMTLSTL